MASLPYQGGVTVWKLTNEPVSISQSGRLIHLQTVGYQEFGTSMKSHYRAVASYSKEVWQLEVYIQHIVSTGVWGHAPFVNQTVGDHLSNILRNYRELSEVLLIWAHFAYFQFAYSHFTYSHFAY